MAAAEYFNSHPPVSHGPANPTYLAPPPQVQRASSHPGYVYPPYQQPNSDPYTPPRFAPPAYQPAEMTKPNPSYAQTPPQRNSFSHQQRPDPQSWNQPYPSPGHLHPQYSPQQYPAQPQQHRPSYSQPYLHQNHSSPSFGQTYNSDEERRRRKHKHHKKPHDSSRSTTTESFLGAAGGGLIGDLIFPGLGAVGGALAGWIGGNEYGRNRKRRESSLEIKQREWEEKWDPDGKRSRRRSHDSRT